MSFFGTPRQQPGPSFVWGQNGQRMTPEDIARQEELAALQMQRGADFSPVGHWTQGLARASQGILGGLQAGRARKAGEANAAESSSVMQALMAGASEPGGNRDAVTAAILNPYISEQARDFAGLEYKRANPAPRAPGEFEQALVAAGYKPGTPEWTDAYKKKVENTINPIVNATVGGRDFFGPRDLLMSQLGGGDQSSGVQPVATPATPPAEAVAELQQNPASAPQFDEVFGPGSAVRILGQGGPTPPASAPFP